MSAENLPRILIVEDERALSLALAAAVRNASAVSELAPTAALAREQLLEKDANFAAMILDIGLPDENGLSFLESLPEDRRPPTLVVTAHGEIENTIAARKLGVIDFLTKPLDFDAFRDAVSRLLREAPAASSTAENTAAFIGAAPAMRPAFQQIAHACASDDPVLIRGETGTGKSLAASLIHRNSARSAGPFVVLSGGGRDELNAKIREAKDGVLVLDDVNRLGEEAQTELLRSWETAGSGLPRILALSSDDLRSAVEAGEFRGELFYRLQVLEVRLPPLRERLEDLPTLLSYFLGQLEPRRAVAVDDAALRVLTAHDWPGNLRELRNVASLALTVSGGAVIDRGHLPEFLREPQAIEDGSDSGLATAFDAWLDERLSEDSLPTYRELSDSIEKALIEQLLKRFDGKLARLAKALNANRSTLRKKLQT